MSDLSSLPEWGRLLAAERHLQQLVPGSVLVGGTPAALPPATTQITGVGLPRRWGRST